MSVVGHGDKWECMKHGEFADRDPESTLSWSTFPECPRCKEVSEKKLCVECEQEPATVPFSQDMMSYIHGFVEQICKWCYYKRVEKHFKESREGYSSLRDELFPEKDQLIGNDESFNKNVRYYRAGGDMICEVCKVCYYNHPVTRPVETQHYGCELHVLCNGDRVKL